VGVFLQSASRILSTKVYRNAGEWARENRTLPSTISPEPGPFDPDRTPYFEEVYDACVSGKYRWVCVVCGSQMAKTEFELNVLGHKYDTTPGPAMVALPDKELARRFSNARIDTLIRYSSLKHKVTKSNVFEKYIAGSQLKVAWTTSASQLCSDPAFLVIMDEIDRMLDDVENEGDPVSLGNARGSNFPNFLLVLVSTPTIDGFSKIMNVYKQGTMLLYCSPCRNCDNYFAPWLENLWYPKDCSSGRAVKEARIICPDCGKSLDDSWRIDVLENKLGIYLGPNQKVINRKVTGDRLDTTIASFRIPGLMSAWVPIGQRAAAWINANKHPDNQANEVKSVLNTGFGELYKVKGEAPGIEELEPLKTDVCSPEVPDWALILLASVDVQKRGLYVCVRAFGPRGKSQSILFEYLEGNTIEDKVWDDLDEKILSFRYKTVGKNPRELKIHKMAIDRRYREEAVDVFCSKHKDKCVGIMGHYTQQVPIRFTIIETNYEGRKKIKGLKIMGINDTHFKLGVFNRIQRGPKVDNAWLLFKDASDEYCAQILSEELISLPSGKMFWKKLRADNHALDTEKYILALANWLKMDMLKEPEKKMAKKVALGRSKAPNFLD